MTLEDGAERLVRPLDADSGKVWLGGGAARYEPGRILRLTEREAVGWDGELRPRAPYELVVVLEVLSPFSLQVARGQFGTLARSYPPGSLLDSIARSPRESERPRWHGFEDAV